MFFSWCLRISSLQSYGRATSAGQIRALESLHLWADSMQVYRTVSGFKDWSERLKPRLRERLETGCYMHSDWLRVSLSLSVQFNRHLENALRSDSWTRSVFKEKRQFPQGNRVDSFRKTDMNTNDAKEYLSRREIPQLFEVSIYGRTFALTNHIGRMCFYIIGLQKSLISFLHRGNYVILVIHRNVFLSDCVK